MSDGFIHNMIDYFLDTLEQTIPLSDVDKLVFREYCKVKTYKKHQFFLQEGDVCKHVGFILKGCFKTYSINKNGDENVFQIGVEGWWISEMYSHLTGEPSSSNIVALEDAEVLILDQKSREEILRRVPQYDRFMRILLERNYVATHRRVNAMLGSSAEDRYLNYIKAYPQMVQRVPQHVIASYLGITPETLSRIRKKI